MNRLWLRFLFLVAAMLGGATSAQAQLTFVLRGGDATANTMSLIHDSNKCTASGPQAQNAGGLITNTGSTTIKNIVATISGLNANVSLTTYQPASQSLGALAPGKSIPVFWLLQYACPAAGNAPVLTASPTMTVTSSAATVSITPTMSIRNAISANAGGKVIGITAPTSAIVGQTVSFDVSYEFGGTAVGDEIFLQPNGDLAFRADCYRFAGSQILTSTKPIVDVPTGDTNRLYYKVLTAQTGSGYTINIRYFFQYQCEGISTRAKPYAVQTSGNTNIKYTGNYDTLFTDYPNGGFPASDPLSTTIQISKSIDQSAGVVGQSGNLKYTVTITNQTANATTIGKFVDVLPTGMSYVGLDAASGVTDANSSSVPTAGATGTLTFEGMTGESYALAGNSSVSLIYTATRPSTAGTFTNSAKGYFGQASTATVTANYSNITPQAPGVVKTSYVFSDSVNSTTNPKAIPGAMINYTLSISNPNAVASDSNSVVVSDATPANMKMCLSDIGTSGSGPIKFTQGATTSALTYTYTSLGSTTDTLDFSNDNGSSWTYTPTADGDGCDSAITNVRVKPTGAFAANSSFSLDLRYKLST